jgi:hypothetical protein
MQHDTTAARDLARLTIAWSDWRHHRSEAARLEFNALCERFGRKPIERPETPRVASDVINDPSVEAMRCDA